MIFAFLREEFYGSFQSLALLDSPVKALRSVPIEEIRRNAGTLIGEGIKRLREGKVIRTPGFDGEYGKMGNACGQLFFAHRADPLVPLCFQRA